MFFSQRYMKALANGTVQIDLPEAVRQRLWTRLKACNSAVYVRRDPHDNWVDNSSVIEETTTDLCVEMGWDSLPVPASQRALHADDHFKAFFLTTEACHVFDVLELAFHHMEADDQNTFKLKTNEIFELASFPWRFSAGKLFKLDSDFVGAGMAAAAHDALAANGFDGATDEFSKARQYLAAGDVREAIYDAGHSFESVMKTLTGQEHANGEKLIKGLGDLGFFDDLPESVRGGFTDQVLKALPFMRNKLGGHGQGISVVTIPIAYGELTVQLAAAFHNFLVAKHLERIPVPAVQPIEAPRQEQAFSLDDEIPF